MNALVVDSITIALIISVIPMAAISLGAGLVALIQAMTQVQEQSIVHFARLVMISVVLIWGGQRAYTEIEGIFMKVVSMAATPSVVR
ncbi:MAG: flagellar biosynthetic protein FliQ [Pseudomonadota bacterium]|jgi:type III secretory pathway component EscS